MGRTSRKHLSLSCAAVALLVAGSLLGQQPEGTDDSKGEQSKSKASPREFFQSRVKAMRTQTVFFDGLPPNLDVIWADISNPAGSKEFLKVATPSASVDLSSWSSRDRGGELPLWWNSGTRKFEVLRGQFDDSSDAIVRFTEHFLRAYDSLHPTLRQSGSTLAQGAAALVALEVVGRENWACLPSELENSATIANLLVLYEPKLLHACYTGDELAGSLRRAVNAMCAVSGEKSAQLPIHQRIDWLLSRPADAAIDGRPATPADILPPHAESMSRLVEKVRSDSGIRNLRLRAVVIAASCPQRFGLPRLLPAARPDWERELDLLLKEVQEEWRKRDEATDLAPAYDLANRRTIVGDSGIIRPLMEIATQAAAASLPDPRDKKKPIEAAAYLTALRADAATSKVLKLGGSDPFVELYAQPEGDGPLNYRTGRIIWPRLVRVALTPDAEKRGERLREESVVAELIDYDPQGQGQPKRGVSEQTRVLVQVWKGNAWKEEIKRAGEIGAGMRVRGYTNVGYPHAPAPIALGRRQKPEWFTVVAVQHHDVRFSLEMDVTPDSPGGAPDANGQTLMTALDHSLFVLRSEKKGIWRPAWHIDPATRLWAGSVSGRIERLRQVTSPQKLVELSLSADSRSLVPNNYEVMPPDAAEKSIRVLVEARPANAGPIDRNELVLLADQSSLPITATKPNPDVKNPQRDMSIIQGFYPRPPADPWLNSPLLSKHATTSVKATEQAVPYAFGLEFADGTTIRLGPGNWLLEYTEGALREVPVNEQLKQDTEIVCGADESGQPKTVKLKAVNRLPKPEHDFVLLEMVNLPWISVNGIVVSADVREWDEAMVGLRGGAAVAQPAVRGAVAGPAAEADPESKAGAPGAKRDERAQGAASAVRIAETTLVLPDAVGASGQGLAGEPLVLWDAGLERLAAGWIGEVRPAFSTRTVVVTAARNESQHRLEVGPSQPLLVRLRGQTETTYVAAADLAPGDQVFVGEPGATKAELWPVKGVVRKFYPGVPVHDVISPVRQLLHDSVAFQADIGFGNRLSFVLSIPVTSRDGGNPTPESTEGNGPGTGRITGDRTGGGAQVADVAAVRIIRPAERLLSDRIELPGNSRTILEDRGQALLDQYESDRTKLGSRAPNAAVVRFWKDVLGDSKAVMPVGSAKPAEAMDQWFSDLMRRRSHFLQPENTNAAYLSHVMALEVMTASWLWELGAPESARLLLLDIAELSAYAGCQFPDRDGLRMRMGRDLELPLMLHVPSFVRGQRRERGTDVTEPFSQPAMQVVTMWANSQRLLDKIVRQDGQVSLNGLYAYWAEKEGTRPKFWYDLSIKPQKDGEAQLEREFRAWLRAMKDRLATESPPIDRAGLRPDVIVEEDKP